VVLQQQKVEHIQTAIRGRTLDPDKFVPGRFQHQVSIQNNQPVKVTCPHGQTEPAHSSSQKKAFVAHFGGGSVFHLPAG